MGFDKIFNRSSPNARGSKADGLSIAPQYVLPPPPTNRGLIDALSGAGTLVILFLVALLMPTYTSFSLGSLRLTLYRAFLVLAFIPCMIQLLSNSRYRIIPADVLVAASSLWAAFAVFYHDNSGQAAETAGIYVLESLGAYVAARTIVFDERSFRGFVAVLTVIVCGLAFFALPETLTGKNLFGQPPNGIEQRYGLSRAQGSFDHPIIFGVFCASVMGLSWCTFLPSPGGTLLPQVVRSAILTATALTSLSSGAIVTLVVQWCLLFWVRITRYHRRRWLLLSMLIAPVYVGIDMLSNRTPMMVFLSYLTLSPDTAYARVNIWEWGFYENALKNPLLGIGTADWVRASWMANSSMDNFWLVLMVQHGLPCFFLLAWAIISLLRSGSKGATAQGVSLLYRGWFSSLIGMVVAASTVHLWNAAFVYFFFLLGVGGWFCNGARKLNLTDGADQV